MKLILAVLCLLMGQASLSADLVSVAKGSEDIQVATLPNGMALLVHERLLSEEEGVSLRLVWNPPSGEHQFMGWDVTDSTLLWTQEFFLECRDELLELKEIIDYPSYWGFRNQRLKGDQFAVIVVGNMTLEEVRPLIELYFDDLFFEENEFEESLEVSRSGELLGDVYCNLKGEWIELLQERLFKEHLEACGHRFQEEWLINPHWGRKGHPKGLNEFLEEVARIHIEGYTEEEFASAKQMLIEQLHSSPDIEHSLLASFYSDLFQIGDRGVGVDAFYELSIQLVHEITYEDIEEELEDFLDDAVNFLEDLYSSQIDDSSQKFAFADPAFHSASWEFQSAHVSTDGSVPVVFVNEVHDAALFHALPLSSSEMRQISYIITTLAEHNVLELAFKKKDLEKRGKRINQVHPLRFMGYILSSAHLRKCAYEIEKSSFKWDAFIGGFAKRMKEEHSKGNVIPYLRGFAELLGVSVDQIIHYVHKKNFEGLVRYLM